MEAFFLKEMVQRALAEDLMYGDRTTETLFPHPISAFGALIAKEELVVAGIHVFQAVFQNLDSEVHLEMDVPPGQVAAAGTHIARLTGDGRALLKGERTALNFLQHLSGIATYTHRFVAQIAGTSAKIVDTRKTTPGLRALEKEAVLLGGGWNHRFHLGDLVLIKDNHIALAGGIQNAVRQTRTSLSHPLKIEVETTTLIEVQQAITSGCDIIMLDNMALPEIKRAVALIRTQAPSTTIEASGGIHLDNVASVAQCGVDMISIGALTHSAPAVDISMDIVAQETQDG
jgi:nicotinate-nucleotide pyrophosphorylase (carboxylating)